VRLSLLRLLLLGSRAWPRTWTLVCLLGLGVTLACSGGPIGEVPGDPEGDGDQELPPGGDGDGGEGDGDGAAGDGDSIGGDGDDSTPGWNDAGPIGQDDAGSDAGDDAGVDDAGPDAEADAAEELDDAGPDAEADDAG
jgi:hypothetical protein